MKEIPLTRGKVALVDDEDYEELARYNWCYVSGRRTYYAMRKEPLRGGGQRGVKMHRVILNSPHGYEIDHINGNGFDNRKENLRVATRAQNRHNVGKRLHNTSGFKGVCWHKATNKWQARIGVDRRKVYLGLFENKIEAALAYNAAAVRLHGEFAMLNQIGEK